ncbi:hypothetical protein GCM10027082_17160 [Comamonas humi]
MQITVSKAMAKRIEDSSSSSERRDTAAPLGGLPDISDIDDLSHNKDKGRIISEDGFAPIEYHTCPASLPDRADQRRPAM